MADRGEIERAAARPMAYFSHDANSAHDIKCRKLIRREGMAGYGRWWRLCELLAATDSHTLEIGTDEDMELYAEELCLDSAKALMQFLVTLSDVGLIRMPGGRHRLLRAHDAQRRAVRGEARQRQDGWPPAQNRS